MKSLGRTWRGRKYAGTQLPVFIEAKNLKPFISEDLEPVLAPINFRTDKGIVSVGAVATQTFWRIPFDNRTVLTSEGGESQMAKTEEGKKVVPVKPYTYKRNGKTVRVKRHKRSTPN